MNKTIFIVFHLFYLFYMAFCFPQPISSLVNPSNSTNSSSSSSSLINLSNGGDLSLNTSTNHANTIDRQNAVINMGQSLSLGITNSITRPITLFNNKVSAAAGTLPGLFAAGGAALGTAIATPIQMGALAANSFVTGFTGTLVSVPISLVSGGTAQLVGLLVSGKQALQHTLGREEILQPLAVVAGSNSILAGIGLNYLSSGIKTAGQRVEQLGLSVTSAGQNIKHFGSVLVGWVNGRPIYMEQTESSSKNGSDERPIKLINAFIPIRLSDRVNTDTPVQESTVSSTTTPPPATSETPSNIISVPTDPTIKLLQHSLLQQSTTSTISSLSETTTVQN